MILVIEIDESMRLILQAVLEDWGYSVLTARDGIEALDLYRERSSEIRLVITDVALPRRRALEVFRQLRALKADVKVVFTFNALDQEIRGRLESEGAAGFLLEPYMPSDLRNLVTALLGEPSSP